METNNQQGGSEQINDLYQHLFNQLEKLKDPDCDLEKEIKRSNAMVNIGNVIVNGYKTEVEAAKITKGTRSKLIPLPDSSSGNQNLLGDAK